MSTLTIILLSLAPHAAAFALLMRHLRRERRRSLSLPVIGSSPALTDALHLRLCRRMPDGDWLHPATMSAKLATWRAQAQAAEQQARNA